MSGFETPVNEHLIRAQIWSRELRNILEVFAEHYSFPIETSVGTKTIELVGVVSLPTAVAMGAAAAIIKNPVVSRRFFSSTKE